MNNKPKIYEYKTMRWLINRLRSDLKDKDFVLMYAYNKTGKTRLSMAFKEQGKTQKNVKRDTLYFNTFTEDLFHWDNDLENDKEYRLKLNADSKFFKGFQQLALEDKIKLYLHRYTNFDFKIDYEKWNIIFYYEDANYIKISRGEESIFIWCIFLAIIQLTIDKSDSYNWVKYLYIDDPISSLDDNNAIAVAVDLAQLLRKMEGKLKIILSSHHGLFFNVMCNELKKTKHKKYFLYRKSDANIYTLQTTDDTPFFHHVAMISELQQAVESGKLYTHHFNILRSILEKTATFFGFENFSDCIDNINDKDLHARALNVLSHGKYSVYEPTEMVDDSKKLFKEILSTFLNRYQFELPDILSNQNKK